MGDENGGAAGSASGAGAEGGGAAGAPAAGAPAAGAPAAGAPAAGAPATIEHAPEFAAIIPPDFKDKPWVKETKDLPGLFKRVEGLMTEIGRRPAGIPQENAKPEEWKAFNKAFGVPEKPEEYKLTPGTAEAPVDEKFQTGIKGVFHQAGVSTRQAAILEKGYNELLAQLQPDPAAADAEFDKLTADVFGNRKDEAIKGSSALIAKFVPEALKGHVASLGNKELTILAGVLDGIRREYIAEDRMPTGGGTPAGMTPEQKTARGRELMASPAYTDFQHADHDKVVEEVRRLYGTL